MTLNDLFFFFCIHNSHTPPNLSVNRVSQSYKNGVKCGKKTKKRQKQSLAQSKRARERESEILYLFSLRFCYAWFGLIKTLDMCALLTSNCILLECNACIKLMSWVWFAVFDVKNMKKSTRTQIFCFRYIIFCPCRHVTTKSNS